jgi:hypothetical protein
MLFVVSARTNKRHQHHPSRLWSMFVLLHLYQGDGYRETVARLHASSCSPTYPPFHRLPPLIVLDTCRRLTVCNHRQRGSVSLRAHWCVCNYSRERGSRRKIHALGQVGRAVYPEGRGRRHKESESSQRHLLVAMVVVTCFHSQCAGKPSVMTSCLKVKIKT